MILLVRICRALHGLYQVAFIPVVGAGGLVRALLLVLRKLDVLVDDLFARQVDVLVSDVPPG